MQCIDDEAPRERHHGPDGEDSDKEDEVGDAVKREEVGKEVVRQTLQEAVYWMERVGCERRRHCLEDERRVFRHGTG